MLTESASASGKFAAPHAALSLSIVIPTRHRLASLQKCLTSIFAAELPQQTELMVICNGSDPATEEYLRAIAASDPRVHVMELKECSPADARNAALGKARGEIIYFLDDDVTIVPDLFKRALATFEEKTEFDVLGGPNLTPGDSSLFERCVGYVLASRFGSARVCDRYRAAGRLRSTDDRALILCNLAIRRRAIADRNPVFGGELVCNEENLLLGLLALEKRRMLHDPALIVYHSRRGTLSGFARQVFKYGRGRWQNTMALPSSLSPVFLIPALFMLYLVALPFVRFTGYLVPLAAYGFLLLVCSLAGAIRCRSWRAFPMLMALFPACHLGYAAGFLSQLVLSALPAFGIKTRSEAATG